MRVLLSINPIHVENIIEGLKIFEFRRRIFARKDIRTVIIYCTKPVGKLVGEFDIEEILESSPDDLWIKTKSGSGITKEYFDNYFDGRDKAFALKIGKVRSYKEHMDPMELFYKFTPPQSYMYIGDTFPGKGISNKRELF